MNFSARFKNSIKSTLKSRSMCQCINEVDALIIQPCCSIFGAYVDMHSTYLDYSKPKEKRKPGAHVEMGRKKKLLHGVACVGDEIPYLHPQYCSFFVRTILKTISSRSANSAGERTRRDFLQNVFVSLCHYM